jgi:hypothetical protein
MKILPFLDIPVMEVNTPPSQTRRIDLAVWAEGDIVKFSAAFVCYTDKGKNTDNYMYQIGFPVENCLVTTRQIIIEVGDHIGKLKSSGKGKQFIRYAELLPKIISHVNLYFEKINTVPEWGTNEFYALRLEGKTIRILEGPHKGGRLRPGETREVILSDRKDIAYGPVVIRNNK